MGMQVQEKSLQVMKEVLNGAQSQRRDRRLENAIASAAIAIGTTTSSVISITQAIARLPKFDSPSEFYLTQLGVNYGGVFLVSILLGILLGGVCWVGLNRWRSPS